MRSGTRAKRSFGDMRSQAGAWDREVNLHHRRLAFTAWLERSS